MKDEIAIIISAALFFIGGAVLFHAGVLVNGNSMIWGILIMVVASISAIAMLIRLRNARYEETIKSETKK